jgi:hypothetical protein
MQSAVPLKSEAGQWCLKVGGCSKKTIESHSNCHHPSAHSENLLRPFERDRTEMVFAERLPKTKGASCVNAQHIKHLCD